MELFKDFFDTVIPAMVAAFAGWFFGRRKQKADAQSGELDNVEKSLSIYRNVIIDLQAQQKDIHDKLEIIAKENADLRMLLQDYTAQNKGLRTENEKLRRRIGHLEKDIETLKEQKNE